MNNNKDVQDALLKTIDTMIDNKIKNLGFNYYVDAVIDKINTDVTPNTYDIKCNNAIYKDVPTLQGIKYQVGDVVQVLIKNGDWNKKFIDDKSKHDTVNDIGQIQDDIDDLQDDVSDLQDAQGNVTQSLATDVFQFAMNCKVGVTPFYTGQNTTNLPVGAYNYSTGIVHRRTQDQIDVYVKNYENGMVATNIYLKPNAQTEGSWRGWYTINGYEMGISNGWTYKKWADGTLEQWGNFSVTPTSFVAWGNIYESNVSLSPQTFPIAFISSPIVNATVYGATYGCFLETQGIPSTTQTSTYYAVRGNPTVTDSKTFNVQIYAFGRWK